MTARGRGARLGFGPLRTSSARQTATLAGLAGIAAFVVDIYLY